VSRITQYELFIHRWHDGVAYTIMYNVFCRSMTIDARHAASISGSSHRKPSDLFGGGLEKFAPTETAGYSACSLSDVSIVVRIS
jgi:hypothetical protein